MTNADLAITPDEPNSASIAKRPICGVVRPIAGIEGYPEGHWLEVHQIIAEAANGAGYDARLVSDDEAIGVILGRIVSNLHDQPIVVVDVSGLNPNVFFELGMRLTFDKPTVVIKDDATRYPFDASPIEYIQYPSDLRHSPLMTFKAKLQVAIQKTAEAGDNPDNRSFLKHFGSVQAGKLGESQSLSTSLVLEELRSLKGLIRRQEPFNLLNARPSDRSSKKGKVKSIFNISGEVATHAYNTLLTEFGADNVTYTRYADGETTFEVDYPTHALSGDQVLIRIHQSVMVANENS